MAFDDVLVAKRVILRKFRAKIVKISSLAPSVLAKSARGFDCEACQKQAIMIELELLLLARFQLHLNFGCSKGTIECFPRRSSNFLRERASGLSRSKLPVHFLPESCAQYVRVCYSLLSLSANL